MLSITRSQVFVLDQDEALDFYVGVLGMEVHTDADLGFMRWLSVQVPGDPSRRIVLERPGAPAMDDVTADQVADLLTKGASGGWLSFETDDPYGMHEALAGKGVDITDEPSEKSYGFDFGIRDPFGNRIRIGKLNG